MNQWFFTISKMADSLFSQQNILMNYIFQQDQLGMTLTTIIDLEKLIEIENHPENAKFISPYTMESHFQFIVQENEIHLSIWDKSTETIIGHILLSGLENLHDALELHRIVIHKKKRRYGIQSLKLLKQYAFERLHLHKLWLKVMEDNEKAIQLFSSEGFKIDGRLRDDIKQNHGYKTILLMSLLESEYHNK